MKSPTRIIISLLFLLLLSVCSGLQAQRDFTEEEKAKIDEKIEALMQQYLELSAFVNEYSTGTIDKESLRKFPELFSSSGAEVYNDLDPHDQTPKQIPVSTYIQYVEKWYPYGLYVEMTPLIKKPEFTFRDQSVYYTVQSTKTVQGNYKGEDVYTFEPELYFTIVFDNRLSSFKIANISTTTGGDSCNIFKKEAMDKFASNDCANARKSYLKAQKFCPSDPDVNKGIASCDSCIDANRKALFLVVRLLPGMGAASINPNGPAFSPSSSFSYGGGIGAELVALQTPAIRLSAGLGFDYFVHNSEATLSSPYESPFIPGMFDRDLDAYAVKYKINSMVEKDKLSFLQIPLYAKFEYFFSPSLGVAVKVGGKYALALSKKFDVENGTFYYEGKYTDPKYGGVVLYDLEEYGFGQFNTTFSGQENKSAKGSMIMIFGGVGLTLKLSPALEIYLGGEYSQGLTSMSEKVNNGQITRKKDDIYSVYEAADVKLSAITGEIGIKFALFRY